LLEYPAILAYPYKQESDVGSNVQIALFCFSRNGTSRLLE
jgi:hypothetical protein